MASPASLSVKFGKDHVGVARQERFELRMVSRRVTSLTGSADQLGDVDESVAAVAGTARPW
jgi:hypothetical protein